MCLFVDKTTRISSEQNGYFCSRESQFLFIVANEFPLSLEFVKCENWLAFSNNDLLNSNVAYDKELYCFHHRSCLIFTSRLKS